MVTDVIRTCALLLVTLLSRAASHYSQSLQLDFLCSPREVGAYVRDIPWDCASYVICMDGVAIPTGCPHGKLYASAGRNAKCEPARNVDETRCAGHVWQYIAPICLHNPTAKIPDASRCGQYLDCAVRGNSPELMDYLLECPYPKLFSTLSAQCEDYRFVACGERPEPKEPCDYLQYMQLYDCSGSNCPACSRHHPSCVGLSDGRHPVPTRNDVMMECEGERTLSIIPTPSNSGVAAASSESLNLRGSNPVLAPVTNLG